MRISKATMQRRHAMQRARERYGIVLTETVAEQIVGLIQQGRWVDKQRQSLRVAVYDLDFEGQLIRVVYDHKRHELVSFLPP